MVSPAFNSFITVLKLNFLSINLEILLANSLFGSSLYCPAGSEISKSIGLLGCSICLFASMYRKQSHTKILKMLNLTNIDREAGREGVEDGY